MRRQIFSRTRFRRRKIWTDLRGRAEEHGTKRRYAGHHSRRLVATYSRWSSHNARLSNARRKQVALQHSKHLGHLHHALVCKWLKEKGGLAGMENGTKRRRSLSTTPSMPPISIAAMPTSDCRSIMNVTFRLPSEELEKKFVSEATAQGLDGLKGTGLSAAFGHRSTTPSRVKGLKLWSRS